jgi:glycosyltransferase involved in cell wall biosynthesis
MASGTPVITSNAASLPEVGGPAAAYFNPTDVTAIAAALKHVLSDPDRQQKMIELGIAQANKFHPDTVGQQVQAFWDALAASRPGGNSRTLYQTGPRGKAVTDRESSQEKTR